MEHSVIQITIENWVELESDPCTEPERGRTIENLDNL